MIPLEHVSGKVEPGAVGRGCCPDYVTYNGDVISVQSLVTGQILKLRVAGEYDASDGALTPLFGKILADNSVVQALSGGDPSYAYTLRLNTTQTPALMARLHAAVPTAPVYNFAGDPGVPETKPGYAIFTDAGDLELGWALTNSQPLVEAALSMALLATIIVVAGWEARWLSNSAGRAA